VLGIVAAASPVHSSGFGAAVAVGPLIPAPATLPLAEIVARLNTAQPPALQGYPSKLAELAREQLAGRLRIAPRSVMTVSELLVTNLHNFTQPLVRYELTDGFTSQTSAPGGGYDRASKGAPPTSSTTPRWPSTPT
jgi:phenylacetate-coenzyme A ligase PaaK-like adenylate-forming protein